MGIALTEPYLALARQQATSAGYADVVTYLEHLIERADVQASARAETVAALREGAADAAAGRARPARAVLSDLAKKYALTEEAVEN